MCTKRDLERKFGIADTTVVRTLKACGLSTRKRRYTAEEVRQFEAARQLFKAGYSVSDVQRYFSLKEVSTDVSYYLQQETD
ncbi:MAG: MerR family transcriptional regulator [Pseudanabaena sp. RU_4_16]|nr:MerR family transcriptional regulator [Pseudanabaena sp. SU_2_4]NJM27281.1 MerR family transcriptional regulator [Pseudanabaena sp. RU_4_16]NKB17337.1 MerR family transcriptional regulator [Pseudanabaena sp. CRU_2_10]